MRKGGTTRGSIGAANEIFKSRETTMLSLTCHYIVDDRPLMPIRSSPRDAAGGLDHPMIVLVAIAMSRINPSPPPPGGAAPQVLSATAWLYETREAARARPFGGRWGRCTASGPRAASCSGPKTPDSRRSRGEETAASCCASMTASPSAPARVGSMDGAQPVRRVPRRRRARPARRARRLGPGRLGLAPRPRAGARGATSRRPRCRSSRYMR